MSQRRIVWLPDTASDLLRLDQFLRHVNPQAANEAIEAISSAASRLSELAERGTFYDRQRDIRELYIPFGHGSYVLRYRVLEDAVIIMRVWHGREKR